MHANFAGGSSYGSTADQARWRAQGEAEERALEYVDEHQEEILAQWQELVQIPGPSGQEEARARWVQQEMKEIGLDGVHIDGKGNVIGVLPGSDHGPNIVFSAHMDTVFPMDTELSISVKDGWLHVPGAADDTAAVVAMLHGARAIKSSGVSLQANLIFLASVQEETGLAGAKYFLDHTSRPIDMFVAVDGTLGQVVCGALGIQWWTITYEVEAAHTLASRGKPNAAVALSQLIQRLYQIQLPEKPLTVLNVGTIGGGTATNAVCAEAKLTVDLRSQCPRELNNLVNQVLGQAYLTAAECEAKVTLECANAIEAGMIEDADKHILTQIAMGTLRDLGIEPELSTLGATDANPAITRGIPGIAIGVVKGRRVHSLEEAAKISSLYPGVKQLILLALRLGNI